MENVKPINHFEIIKRDWRKIVVVSLLIVLLSLILTLIQPFLYRANVSIFVVQKSSFSIDAYSASKSEERIANKLAQVVYSSSFLEEVLSAGFDIDKSYFPADEYKRRQKWNKIVEAGVPAGLSKLDIKIYHQDPAQALQLVSAVSFTLTEKKREFIGIEDIDLKVLDSPLVSKYPVKPDVILNLLVGILVGLIIGIAYVIVSYNPRRDKLFGMKEVDEKAPHLVDYRNIPAEESVEQDLDQVKEVIEIKDLEEVEDLAEAEEDPEKPVEEVEDAEQVEDISLPNLVEQIVSEDLPGENVDSEKEEKLIPPAIPSYDKPKHRELPKFAAEDEFVGMPDSKE